MTSSATSSATTTTVPKLGNPVLRDALKAAIRAGWRTEPCKAGVLVFPPNGSRPIAVHRSYRGGGREVPAAVVQMRRAGLAV